MPGMDRIEDEAQTSEDDVVTLVHARYAAGTFSDENGPVPW